MTELQEIVEYLSGNKSFESITIDSQYKVVLEYQNDTVNFDSIEDFKEIK